MKITIFWSVVSVLVFILFHTSSGRIIQTEITKKLEANAYCNCPLLSNLECGCCIHLDESLIIMQLDDTACLNVTFRPMTLGVSVTFQLDGITLINQTISMLSPPTLCSVVPTNDIGQMGVCLSLTGTSLSRNKFGACLQVELKLLLENLKLNFGCWYSKLEKITKPERESITTKELDSTKDMSQNFLPDDAYQTEHNILENLLHREKEENDHLFDEKNEKESKSWAGSGIPPGNNAIDQFLSEKKKKSGGTDHAASDSLDGTVVTEP